MKREIKFNCIITGNNKEKIAEFTEWLDGDGWKHNYYSPLVTNGVFSHEELGDGWFGEIIRRQFTGAKDRDGIEIYEGDKDVRDYVIMWSEEHCLFCQHFYQSYFNKWAEASYPMDASRVKINRNIYETPELLNTPPVNP